MYRLCNIKCKDKKIQGILQVRSVTGSPDDFFYPLDREYLDCVNEISSEYERFRAEIRTRASEDMDFVTKWLHDMKVPISALKLILENGSEALPRDMYERMDIEIARIQQSTQDLFYNLKSESFSDDYRITSWHQKLVADVLKEYASFSVIKNTNINFWRRL